MQLKDSPQKQQFVYQDIYQTDLFDYNQIPINFPRPKTLDELCAITFADGRVVYKHQAENVDFISRNGFRAVCADDTGLGKTLTVCALLHEFPETLLPALIICRTTLKIQWFVELLTSCKLIAQVISYGQQVPDEEFDVHIISYDMLKRIPNLYEMIQPKLIVLDECQAIKNWESARTGALVQFAKNVPYIIGTSADPIKNDALEYYPILHMTKPSRFNNRAELERMCDYRQTGTGSFKRGGIAPWYENQWKDMTKDIIIRHKREDVMPDLPTVRRSHRYVSIEDQEVNNRLNEAYTEFLNAYDSYKDYDKESAQMSYAQARMAANVSLMRLRHIVGDAKIAHALDFIEEFLNEGEPTKRLTIFVHHKTVADGILAGIEKLRNANKITCNSPFILRGGMNEEQRNELVSACTINQGWPTNDPFDRLLLASTLAAGEGINLQKCHDCIMVERQFNPPNEEQAFGRFSRIGIAKGVDYIFATYLTALNTIDSWFDKLVESKREALRKTHGDKLEYGSQWGEEDEIVTDLLDTMANEIRKIVKRVKRNEAT